MNVDRIVHRTLFKHRLLLFVCLLFLVYILFSTDSLVTHLKIRLLSNRSFVRDTSQHKHGQFVSDENGNFMYYHLPNLDDYDIGQYYFELNSNGLEAYNETLTAKYCLRNGTDLVDVQQSSHHQLKCLCKANYTGSECSIPPLINLTVESKLIANISRLRRPRRIVLSLVWLTYEYTDGNRTSKIIRLEHFTRTFEMMARYIDLFIVHELRLLTNESTIDDPYSLKSQFINGLLSKHSEYTLLYSRDIPLDQQNGQIDLEKLEFALMRQSWHLFTTRTTEYRPADLLIFLSINNFIHEDILLYLKYHAGLMDIIHLQPIQSTFLHQSNSTLFNITNEAVIISEFKFKSFISMSQNSFPSNYSGGSFHLKNVIITFEFITFLCNYQFDLFVINYCLVDSKQLDHFKANFWPINLVSIGNGNQNLSCTFAII